MRTSSQVIPKTPKLQNELPQVFNLQYFVDFRRGSFVAEWVFLQRKNALSRTIRPQCQPSKFGGLQVQSASEGTWYRNDREALEGPRVWESRLALRGPKWLRWRCLRTAMCSETFWVAA